MIPNPWVILGAVGFWLLSSAGVYFYSAHHESLAWQASLAKQQQEAADLRDQLKTAKHDKEMADAKYALDLDFERARREADITAAADAARPRINQLVQQLTACRRSGSGSVPGTAPAPSSPAGTAAGSDGGLSQGVGERLTRLGRDANKLAATVRTCVDWAQKVGR